MPYDAILFFVTLILVGLCVQLHLQGHPRTLPLTALMLLICGLSLYGYSNYGRWFSISPKDAVYTQVRGNQPLKTYMHWHEMYHYYLGAKYFPELGYNGLYEAVVLADAQSAHPVRTTNEIRSLREPTRPISVNEALQRAQAEFRPRFTDARWEEFGRDLEQFKSFALPGWLDTGLFDAGYNPPPSWAVIGYTVANLVPIDQAAAWFDGRPSWYQMEFLPWFDVLLLAIIAAMIWRTFGFPVFTAFLLLFATSQVASYGWISGSFFRYTWFFGLAGGLCLLARHRWFLAGVFMGLAAVDRIFPIVFLAGAALPLFIGWIKQRDQWRPFVKFVLGAMLMIYLMVAISLALFGWEMWQAFFQKIALHKEMFFVHHIGYRRIAVFADWVPGQNFWWGDGLRRFAVWNAKLVDSWHQQEQRHLPFMAILVVSAFIAAWRIKPEEAALLFGGVVLFLFAIPANYYYIYFPLVAVVLLAAEKSPLRDMLIVALFLLWAYLRLAPALSRDDLVQNYYICWGFLIFFTLWPLLRSYETIQHWLSSPKRG